MSGLRFSRLAASGLRTPAKESFLAPWPSPVANDGRTTEYYGPRADPYPKALGIARMILGPGETPDGLGFRARLAASGKPGNPPNGGNSRTADIARLNPGFTRWLMGAPADWLLFEPLETR